MSEKRPRLFYFEDAESCWAPAPDKIEHIIDLEHFCGVDNEVISINFKVVLMTDEEFDNLPET